MREVSSRFLSEDERVAIADLHRRGLGVRAIAAEVGRSPATISRELRRNLDPTSSRPIANTISAAVPSTMTRRIQYTRAGARRGLRICSRDWAMPER